MSHPIVIVLAGFVVSAVLTPAGVSGAFLLVPFQVSGLGSTTVAVTPTNLLFNVIATPSGIYAYWREGRLDTRLAVLITAGSLPGVVVGVWLRVEVFADPARFEVLVGGLLMALGVALLLGELRRIRTGVPTPAANEPLSARHEIALIAMSAAVGVIGGIYGIGGGAIIAPLLVVVTRRPLSELAGAALVGTFVTSAFGVAAFEIIDMTNLADGAVGPAWSTGVLLGIGGVAGSYLGARLQGHVPERALRFVLGVVVAVLGVTYVVGSVLD